MQTKVSFWLVPTEEDRNYFQDIIDSLADTYDAPSFIPHVTIYSGEYDSDASFADIIKDATRGVQRVNLKSDGIQQTEEFTKSLFVQFRASYVLNQISKGLRRLSVQRASYSLNPHLSLIYKDLSDAQKQELIQKINLPQSEVQFDEIMAISTPATTKTADDVESWRVLHTHKLLSFARYQSPVKK